jgi:hypothetical protein
MDGIYTTRLPGDKTKNCRDCPTHCHCAVLESCLHVLDSVSIDARNEGARQLCMDLQARISALGFAYPYGERPCALWDRPDEAKALIDESIAAVQSLCCSPR